ncbi:MAG TPA: hypothetical protein VFQ53_07545 [Kofleriaceae bacterium]|nr:hypothetical protein [Kofleriaceae bacterium]
MSLTTHVLVAITTLSLAACAAESDPDPIDPGSMLAIQNDSSFTFVEINLAPIDSTTFGPDLLGANVLDPGERLEISDIDCDTYDIRVVDETNAMCILSAVDLCLDNAVWHIDDTELAICSF